MNHSNPQDGLQHANFTNREFSEESSSQSDAGNRTENTYMYYGPAVVASFTVALSIIMLISVFGNLLVIATILRNRLMRTRTNLLLCNLALADILVGLIDVPIAIVTLNVGDWPFSQELCKFNSYMVGMGIMLSLHTLMYISIHKFYSIKNMFKSALSLRTIYLMVAAAWGWAIFYNTLSVLGWTQAVYKTGSSQCGPAVPKTAMHISHSAVNKVCNFVIPLSVMTVFYSKIFSIVREHLKNLGDLPDMKVRNSLIQQKKILKTLVTVLVCFCLCYVPYIAYSSSIVILKQKGVKPIFNPLAYLFMYMNSACNPIIYSLMFPKFRRGFKDIICGKSRRSDWVKYNCRTHPPATKRPTNYHAVVIRRQSKIIANKSTKTVSRDGSTGWNQKGYLVYSFKRSLKRTRSEPELNLRGRQRIKRYSQPATRNQKFERNEFIKRQNTKFANSISSDDEEVQSILPESHPSPIILPSITKSPTPSQLTVGVNHSMNNVRNPPDSQSGLAASTLNDIRMHIFHSAPDLVQEDGMTYPMNYLQVIQPDLLTPLTIGKAMSDTNIMYQGDDNVFSQTSKLGSPSPRTPRASKAKQSKARLSIANFVSSLRRSFSDIFVMSSVDYADEDDEDFFPIQSRKNSFVDLEGQSPLIDAKEDRKMDKF